MWIVSSAKSPSTLANLNPEKKRKRRFKNKIKRPTDVSKTWFSCMIKVVRNNEQVLIACQHRKYKQLYLEMANKVALKNLPSYVWADYIWD